MQFFFKESMQVLFGSIISLQIIAHIPLANVMIPADALQSFDIMVQIVSFDYFPFTDYIDLGFTETEPWSANFAFLGYETINFIECLGSIMIFIWIGTSYIFTVMILWILRRLLPKLCCISNPKVKNFFDPISAWNSTLGFL